MTDTINQRTWQPNRWLYSNFTWLSRKDALEAEKQRSGLLEALAGKVNYHCLGSKISTGELSPGCLICASGYWSCLFINGLCTSRCFYCPQDRTIKEERAPFCHAGVTFESPDEYVNFLQQFGFQGVGLSGGESLLAFKKVAQFIKKIRERFKRNLHLWLYTNGDLVNASILRKLRDLGLNEIRFNISAQGYNLRPVELAAGILDTVTVEVPAIPEDYATLQERMKQMQAIGVKFLNLHQLSTTKHNYKNFVARGYTFLHQPRLPVLESEITALRLLKYAVENRLQLSTHYCSCSYQCRFQAAGLRQRYATLAADGCEEITDAGYIRRISMREKPAKRTKAAALKQIASGAKNITIRYFRPQLAATFIPGEKTKEIALGQKNKLFVKKILVGKYMGITHRASKKQSTKLLAGAKKWEQLAEGFPPIH